MKTYKIKYKFEPGEFTSNDADPSQNEGLTDVVLFASILQDEGGATSTAWVSRDGNGPMAPNKMFMQWGILAKDLSEMKDLAPGAKRICADVFKLIQELICQPNVTDS